VKLRLPVESAAFKVNFNFISDHNFKIQDLLEPSSEPRRSFVLDQICLFLFDDRHQLDRGNPRRVALSKFGTFSDKVAPWDRVEVILGATAGELRDSITFALSDPQFDDFSHVFVSFGNNNEEEEDAPELPDYYKRARTLLLNFEAPYERDQVANLLFAGYGAEATFEKFLKTWLTIDARFAVGVTRAKWDSVTRAFKALNPDYGYSGVVKIPDGTPPPGLFYPGPYKIESGNEVEDKKPENSTEATTPNSESEKEVTTHFLIFVDESEDDVFYDSESPEKTVDDEDGSADWPIMSDDSDFQLSSTGVVDSSSLTDSIIVAAAETNATLVLAATLTTTAAPVLIQVVTQLESDLGGGGGDIDATSSEHQHGPGIALVSFFLPLVLLIIIIIMIFKLGKRYFKFKTFD
jgi:hypothetical protein